MNTKKWGIPKLGIEFWMGVLIAITGAPLPPSAYAANDPEPADTPNTTPEDETDPPSQPIPTPTVDAHAQPPEPATADR